MNYKTRQSILIFLLLFVPLISLAQYQPLVGIPTLEKSNDFSAYMNALYGLSISVAALIAVIKIIIAGVKYMMTGLISGKEEAKNDIRDSLLGLLIIISAVLILNQINPQLSRNNLFLSKSPSGVTPSSPEVKKVDPMNDFTKNPPKARCTSLDDNSNYCRADREMCKAFDTSTKAAQLVQTGNDIVCKITSK